MFDKTSITNQRKTALVVESLEKSNVLKIECVDENLATQHSPNLETAETLAIQQRAILRSVTNGVFRSLQDFATKTQNWGFAENGFFRFQTSFLRRRG